MTSRSPRPGRLLVAGGLGFALVAALLLLVPFLRMGDRLPPPEPMAVPAPVEPRPVSGVLRISLHGAAGRVEGVDPGWTQVSDPLTHTGTWVNGPNYEGHAENDIRGFLDGRFRYAFNQVSQTHVRVGRVGPPVPARMGERELLRTLHRWDDLGLPATANVTGSRLEILVEERTERELDLFLYRVNKDWLPGQGGVERDNFSEPAFGEVWWNERMKDVAPWGLPGAGFASDDHPEADTPVTPLARARYVPGDSVLAFESTDLSSYIQERAAAGEPLLLLLKLSDYQEDTDGTLLNLYSSNHGDSRNTARRPRLTLEWNDPDPILEFERPVILEYGRSLILPRLPASGSEALSVTFVSDADYASPRVMVRGGPGEARSQWMDASIPLTHGWDSIEVRLDAFINPTGVHKPFRAEFRDTWVPNGPPEDQEVRWVFVSPSGRVHERGADYLGDYVWAVEFSPDELGRWTYRWDQDFLGIRYESALGFFDVIVEDREAALDALVRLTDRIEGAELRRWRERVEVFGPTFTRLERAVMQLESPETFPMIGESTDPDHPGYLLDAARSALIGVPISDAKLP